MATDTPLTISRFLKSQVLRADYLLIDEHRPERTRFAHEQKLEFLHTLCISKGYAAVRECEEARRRLYTQEYDETCPPHLLLALAYLPHNIGSLPAPALPLDAATVTERLRNVSLESHGTVHYQMSSERWNRHQYWMYLPDDIHSLLIDRDSALLAA